MASLRHVLTRSRALNLSGIKFSGITVGHGIRNRMSQRIPSLGRHMSTVPANNPSAGEEKSSADPENVKQDGEKTSSKTEVAKYDYDEYDDYEPKTAGEAVSMYTVYGLRLLFWVVAAGCVIVTLRELFPGRLSPQSLFSEAFEVVKNHDEIRAITGDGMKAYGRDIGRNEGRRNHVDSRKYDAEDGSKRMRVRFNVQGPRGKCLVWAEVSDKMSDNEYVYLICQDLRTGRVVTVEDNRSRLDTEQLSKGPDNEIMSKINSIFSGGK